MLRPDCILASSTHFSVVFSLFFQCVFDAQPAFTFFCSEDIAAYVAPDSVSVGVGEFSIYLHRVCLNLPYIGWAWGPCGISRHPASPRGAHQVGAGDQGLRP